MHSPLTFQYEQPQSFQPDFWQVARRFSTVSLGLIYHAGGGCGWIAIKLDGFAVSDGFKTRHAAALWLAGLSELSV